MHRCEDLIRQRAQKVEKPSKESDFMAGRPRKTDSSKPQKRKMSLRQQANQILKQAEERGVSSNYFFATTFRRYQTQLDILEKLEKSIEDHGLVVTKEYVKGRENLVTNPAITEYNKTATAANGTVSTLINIIKTLSNEPDAVDALSEFLKDNG